MYPGGLVYDVHFGVFHDHTHLVYTVEPNGVGHLEQVIGVVFVGLINDFPLKRSLLGRNVLNKCT